MTKSAEELSAKMGRKKIPTEERFWAKVTIGAPNDCWLWNGKRDRQGYGRICTGYKKDGCHNPIMTRAHRYSYFLHKGEFSQDLFVCHACDNPSCVNPDHLWLGTCLENNQDSKNKNRKNPVRKIKEEDAIRIRRLYKTGLIHRNELAVVFGVEDSAIDRLLKPSCNFGLISQNNEAAAPKWIKCSERLPEFQQWVLGCFNTRLSDWKIRKIQRVVLYDCEGYQTQSGDFITKEDELSLTHWMPLPEAPKEENE